MRRHAKAPSAGSIGFVRRLAGGFGLAGLAAIFVLAVGASQALAVDQTYLETGSFGSGPGAGNGELNHPRRIAVNETSGDVYVADRDNNRVVVFRPSGGSATYLTQFGSAQLDAPFGIAIDQSDGSVYVSSAGNDKIVKFDSDGFPTPSFSVDAGFTSPALGSGAAQIGDFEADLAVDPTTGDLLVADPGNNEIKRYDGNGGFLSAFDGSSAPGGAFEELLDIDVEADGDILAVDANGPLYEEGEPEGGSGPCVQNNYCGTANSSRTLRFAPDGTAGTAAIPANSYGYVAADPTNSQLLLGVPIPQGARIAVYRPDGTGPLAEVGSRFSAFSGIAVDAVHKRVFMVNDIVHQNNFNQDIGAMEITALAPANFPSIVGGVTVSAVTSESAHLSATVNPNGEETTARFEYARNGEWKSLPAQNIGAGTAPVAVEADLSELSPSAEYQARLAVSNTANVSTSSAETGFTTASTAPSATTIGAGPRTTTTARLNGWVNPFNLETTYHFEFGPTSSYGSSLAATPAVAGSGDSPIAVSAPVSGLAPGATYHFRLVAESAGGTTVSPDQSFTTRTGNEPGLVERGIELVNNPDKGNQAADLAAVNSDASKIVWTTYGGLPGGPTGSRNMMMAQRTAEGWRSKSLLPGADQLVDHGESSYKMAFADPNFDRFIYEVSSGIEVNPPVTMAAMGVDYDQRVLGVMVPQAGPKAVQASDDFSHVYRIDGDYSTHAGQLYDVGSGQPKLVSIMPNGTPADCGAHSLSGFQDFGVGPYEWMATDAGATPRVYFESEGEAPCAYKGPFGQKLYVRNLDTATTMLLSGPALPGGPQSEEGMMLRASDDGTEALFVAMSRLTSEDTNDGGDIYRYEVGSPLECLTCVGPGADLVVSAHFSSQQEVVSNDLSRAYFVSHNVLVPGEGEKGANNLYLVHDGAIRYIAPVGSVNVGAGAEELTDRDRVLYFSSDDPEVTTDETGGYAQIYRYSEVEESIECISCVPGHVPTAFSLAFGKRPVSNTKIGSASSDGESFVFMTDDALDPRDVNRDSDIYEWRNGHLGLVTDGVSQYPNGGARLDLLGIGSDGLNIVFRSNVNVTGHELDGVGQVYVARAGGGFPRPAGPPAPCGEESCQGPLIAPPPSTDPGSASNRGAGNVRESTARKKPRKSRACTKGRKAKPGKARSKCSKKRANKTKRGVGR